MHWAEPPCRPRPDLNRSSCFRRRPSAQPITRREIRNQSNRRAPPVPHRRLRPAPLLTADTFPDQAILPCSTLFFAQGTGTNIAPVALVLARKEASSQWVGIQPMTNKRASRRKITGEIVPLFRTGTGTEGPELGTVDPAPVLLQPSREAIR